MHPQRGQASLEWVALVALLTVVFAACAVPAGAGSDIGRRVTRELARALCTVTGGECRHDREPCVLSSRRQRDHWHVNLAVVRLGKGYVALVEERSDGSVAVTRVREREEGLEGGLLGAQAEAFGLSIGGEIGAAAIARGGQGRTWLVGDRAAADRLLRAMLADKVDALTTHAFDWVPIDRLGKRLPRPVQTFNDDGWSVALSAGAGATAKGVGADLTASLSASNTLGSRLDHRTGRRTIYLRGAGEAEVRVALAGDPAASVSAASPEIAWGLVVDRHGAPRTLTLTRSGRLGGSADLPAEAQEVAGRLAVPVEGKRAYVVERRLDLTDPANRAAAAPVLAALASRRPASVPPGAAAALAARLRGATVEARVHAVDADERALAVSGTAGVKVGAGAGRSTSTSRLVAAQSRGHDGQWLGRTDCA